MKLLNKYYLLTLILSCLILISCNNQHQFNIANDMKNGLENELIKQLYAEDIKNVYEITNSKQIKIWYCEIDLNDDDYKDIIVIVQSPLHSGSHGDSFDIWINDGNGEYQDISGLTISIISIYPEYNGKIYISNEKTNGFKNINIILSDGKKINLIYQNGKYDFFENEIITTNIESYFDIKEKIKKYNYNQSDDYLSEIRVESALFVYKAVADLIDICITYPQITTMPDSFDYKLRNIINKNIFEDILINFDFFEFQTTRIDANIDFEITFLDYEKICIVYYGDISDWGHHNIFDHTAIFDMRTGEKMEVDSIN